MTAPAPIRKRILPLGAAMAVAAFLAAGAWMGVEAIAAQPASRVMFSGDVARIPASELEAFAQGVQGAGAAVSLAAIREAARRLPWVREATVRRRFPDTVEIALEAHEALARWSDERLVSVRGELFQGDYAGDLPRFAGPDGAAPAMTLEYARIAQAVAPLAARVRELSLGARGAWQVTLDNGYTFDLGRGDVAPRLQRFVAAWSEVQAKPGAGKHVDLRYANGFAVRAVAARRP